jgi:hypothetical protein
MVAREDHRVTSRQMRSSYLNGIATESHIALRLSNRCNPHLFAKKKLLTALASRVPQRF